MFIEKKWRDAITELIMQREHKVIIFDNLSCLFLLADENKIKKTKGMDAVDTDEVRLAVHKKTGIGRQVLKNDLKTQQRKW